MLADISGRVWKFGDNISTDFMAPGYSRYKGLSDREEALFCMRSNRPDWAEKVRAGDIIIGGKNFGCGSSRMEAPRNLKILGISCIIAESFGRIFFRNAISIGLAALTCKGVCEAFNEGDIAQVAIKTGIIVNLTTGRELTGSPLPRIALQILEAGGVLALLKSQYGKQQD